MIDRAGDCTFDRTLHCGEGRTAINRHSALHSPSVVCAANLAVGAWRHQVCTANNGR